MYRSGARSKDEVYDTWVEALIFAADRRQQFLSRIQPLLSDKCVILLDRFTYSGYVYHGRWVPQDKLAELCSYFPSPDLAHISRLQLRDSDEKNRLPRIPKEQR